MGDELIGNIASLNCLSGGRSARKVVAVFATPNYCKRNEIIPALFIEYFAKQVYNESAVLMLGGAVGTSFIATTMGM